VRHGALVAGGPGRAAAAAHAIHEVDGALGAGPGATPGAASTATADAAPDVTTRHRRGRRRAEAAE
jgi:hypothetical protein